jgi:hypothetical protein
MVDNQEDEEDLKLSPAELKESLVRTCPVTQRS